VSATQLGYLFGTFLISLLVGFVATIVGQAFRVGRRSRFLVGAALAILGSFVGGASALSLLGGLLAVAALYGWLITEQNLIAREVDSHYEHRGSGKL
jgi:hypothetical protein